MKVISKLCPFLSASSQVHAQREDQRAEGARRLWGKIQSWQMLMESPPSSLPGIQIVGARGSSPVLGGQDTQF